MGAFEQVDLLRREFGERWTFTPIMRRQYGKAQLDSVRARQKNGARKLVFSSPAELAERIREIEASAPSRADVG